MKRPLIKRACLWIALFFTVQAVCLCCVSAYTRDNGTASRQGQTAVTEAAFGDSVSWLNEKLFAVTHSRGRWLCELMDAAGLSIGQNIGGEEAFEAARRYGIVDSYAQGDPFLPVTRRFVAHTLVRAFGYQPRSAGYIADIPSYDTDMNTTVYYGYFLPDTGNRVFPDAELTPEEYETLETELMRYRLLHGKRVLSFGDSIMYGTGNDGEGISDMLAQKYGMQCADYAVPGATVGVSEGRSHIPDQIRSATAIEGRPDLILFNGGTNDMNHTPLGSLRHTTNPRMADETDYTSAMEKTMWLFDTLWNGVPVVYVRVHNMDLGNDNNEKKYGERGMEIASKWGAAVVDLYNDTDMNTEDPYICNRYTFLNPSTGYTCDAIHPTALGYAKFYLPLITATVVEQLS